MKSTLGLTLLTSHLAGKLMNICLRRIAVIILCLISILPTGCAGYLDLPSGTVKEVHSAIVAKKQVTVPVIKPTPPLSNEYIIGVNDVLSVSSNCPGKFVGARMEAGGIGVQPSETVLGSRVDGSGNIQLPKVGLVHVAGLTMAKAQAVIRKSFRKYVKEPWVVVEVAEFRSKPIYLLGQFKNPGAFYLDRPLSLTQGIAMGNGFETNAYLRGARLNRDNKIIPVDIYDLLFNGNQAQNIRLKAGDTIYIPDNSNQQVFVFGAVRKSGPIPMQAGGLNLAQAISSAELSDTRYNFKHIRIIRSLSATRGELMVIDFDRILRGEALPLPLMEGDIVYVPRSRLGAWNDAVGEMLPSLQTISAILQPFVQLKFLSSDR